MSFLYGGPPPVGQGWPLEVQIWRSCQRNRSSSITDPPGPIKLELPREDTSVRGVPASWFHHRGLLELYTGRETIALFRTPALSSRRLREAADALAGVNNPARPGQRLPEPLPGALEGKLRC